MKKLIAMLIMMMVILTSLPISSAQGLAEKDEVVYAKFNHTGGIDLLSVVNVFRLETPGTIVDYGDYETTLNLTSLEEIKQAKDEIRVKADQGVFYYQGNNPKKELPWIINLTYWLDGKEVPAEDLAGANGELKIQLQLKRNPSADKVFFEHYVLQVSFQFPQSKFELIEAPDATPAQNGEDQMLTYTVLPGKEATFRLTGKVTDFSMKPMMINGLPFQMAFDLPNMDDSLSDLTKLQDGIKQLNDGAQALASGLDRAASGGYSLLGGADQLAGAGSQLSGGLKAFHGGLVQYQDGLNAYKDGVVQFDGGLGDFAAGLRQFSNGLNSYATGSDTATSGLNQYVDGVNTYVGGIQQMLTMVQPLIDQLDGIKDVVGDVNIRQAVQDTIKASEQIQGALTELSKIIEQADLQGLDEVKAASAQFLKTLQALDQSGIDVSPLIGSLQASLDSLTGNLSAIRTVANSLRNPDLGAIGADPNDPNTQAMLAYMTAQADQLDALVTQLEASTTSAIPAVIQGLTSLQDQVNASLAQLGSLAAMYQPIDTMIQSLSLKDLEAMKTKLLEFTSKYGALHDQLVTYLNDLLKNLPDTVETVKDGIDQVTDGMKQLSDGSTQLVEAGNQVKSGFGELNKGAHDLAIGGASLADGAESLRVGHTGLTDGIKTLASNFDLMVSGTNDISWGIDQLSGGLGAYRDGVNAYVSGIGQAGDGSRQLAGGTDELYRQTSNMDQMFKDKFNEMTQEFIPKDFDPVSFVSAKNKNVQVVQFVMMGQGINLPAEEEPPIEEPVKKNIWERIKDLF